MTRLLIARHGNTFDKGDVLLRVGKRTDLQGCIGPGMRIGVLSGQQVVLASRIALNKFHQKLNYQPFTLIVKDV